LGELFTDVNLVVNVLAVNTPPRFEGWSDTAAVDEGQPLTFNQSALIDPDEGGLNGARFELFQRIGGQLVAPPSGALVDPVSGRLSWTPDFEQGRATPYTLVIRVYDGRDPFVTNEHVLEVTVRHVNRDPVVEITDLVTAENRLLIHQIVAADPDGDPLIFNWLNRADFEGLGPLTLSRDGALSWLPGFTAGRDAPYELRFTVNGGPENIIRIHVVDVQRLPIVDAIEPQVVDERQTFALKVNAFNPEDVNNLRYRFDPGFVPPAGFNLNATTGIITWTPGSNDGGRSFGVTVNVWSDLNGDGKFDQNEAMQTVSFNLTVRDVNRAPIIKNTTTDLGTRELGQETTIQIAANDPDGDALTYLLGQDSREMATIDANTGVLIIKPGVTGALTITVLVRDTAGAEASLSFVMNVIGPDVGDFRISSGSGQSSLITSVSVTFGANVAGSITAADLVLVNQTTGETIAANRMTMVYDPSTRTATWSFAGLTNGRLPEGVYSMRLAAGAVQNQFGVASANAFEVDFHVLTGDANGDRVVNDQDLLFVFSQKGGRNTRADLNGDGKVDDEDIKIVAANYLRRLASLPSGLSSQSTRVASAILPASRAASILEPTRAHEQQAIVSPVEETKVSPAEASVSPAIKTDRQAARRVEATTPDNSHRIKTVAEGAQDDRMAYTITWPVWSTERNEAGIDEPEEDDVLKKSEDKRYLWLYDQTKDAW
jgi:hypothetical protein